MKTLDPPSSALLQSWLLWLLSAAAPLASVGSLGGLPCAELKLLSSTPTKEQPTNEFWICSFGHQLVTRSSTFASWILHTVEAGMIHQPGKKSVPRDGRVGSLNRKDACFGTRHYCQ
eukprot:s400_g18.t1